MFYLFKGKKNNRDDAKEAALNGLNAAQHAEDEARAGVKAAIEALAEANSYSDKRSNSRLKYIIHEIIK